MKILSIEDISNVIHFFVNSTEYYAIIIFSFRLRDKSEKG